MNEIPHREKYWWEHYPLHKWWCNDACPLVPRFSYREGDGYNSNNWSFHWLLLEVWSMEHFSFSIDAEISPSHGAHIGCILPYLRMTIGIRHTYYNWQRRLSESLRRKPAKERDNERTE